MAYLLFTIVFTWFRLGSLGFRTGFPEIVFYSPTSFHILGIDPGWSFRFQASTLNAQSKVLKCVEQIEKSPTKHRALSFSTGLLCKETPVLRSATLLQPCTSFPRPFLTLHSLISGKNRHETCDFSRSYYADAENPR